MSTSTGWLILLVSGLLGAPRQDPETLVKGAVTLKGVAPEGRKLKPTHEYDQEKILQLYPGGVPFDAVVVNKEKRIKWALVYVKTGLEGKTFDLPKAQVHLDFDRFLFNPRVLGIRVGQELIIGNNDDAVHNASILPKENTWTNVLLDKKGKLFKRTFSKPELGIKVACDLHPEGGVAWVAVLSHPFFFVTGESGEYQITGLPPGKYTLEAWQDHCAPVTREIEIGEKETKNVDFELEVKNP